MIPSFQGRNLQFVNAYGIPDLSPQRWPDLRNLLSNTNITDPLRRDGYDWLLEIVKATPHKNFRYSLFFKSIMILDMYLKYSKEIVETFDFNVTVVTCFFIASKYEEHYPIRLKQ